MQAAEGMPRLLALADAPAMVAFEVDALLSAANMARNFCDDTAELARTRELIAFRLGVAPAGTSTTCCSTPARTRRSSRSWRTSRRRTRRIIRRCGRSTPSTLRCTGSPRDCPRLTAWPRTGVERTASCAAFATTADRVPAIECSWLAILRRTELASHRFDAVEFRPWPDASGQWIRKSVVEPIDVQPVGDLLTAHADAGIEMRVVPSLWPLHDLAMSGGWDFSSVRMRNAQPRG